MSSSSPFGLQCAFCGYWSLRWSQFALARAFVLVEFGIFPEHAASSAPCDFPLRLPLLSRGSFNAFHALFVVLGLVGIDIAHCAFAEPKFGQDHCLSSLPRFFIWYANRQWWIIRAFPCIYRLPH